MNLEVKKLIEIQEFDKRIVKLEEEFNRIEKKEHKIVEVIKNKKIQLNTIKEEKEDIKKDIQFKTDILKETMETLKKLEVKLNSTTTEKQMKSVNMEIDIAKTNKTVLEERLETLEKELELKEKDIKELEVRYASLEKTLEDYKIKFAERREEIQKEIAEIRKEKEKLFDIIDSNLLQKYEKLNKWTKGTSVVPMRKDACYGCFIKLTPQVVTSLKETDKIIYCPNCGRILYIEEAEATDDDA